ncbi:MAG: hypothetical protein KDB63_03460 [Nocardioidaceae bacterium]|nr:hypothetical protein [Nocardioidaceae bacterium]
MSEPNPSTRSGLIFEDFVRDVAPHLVGPGVESEAVYGPKDLGVDIVVEGPGGEVTLIEARSDTPATRTRLTLVAERLRQAARAVSRGRRVNLVLASPGLLSDERLEILRAADINYWNGLKLVRAAREAGVSVPSDLGLPTGVSLVKPPETVLRQRLQAVPSGTGGWFAYQAWCRDVLEFLFHPPLNAPAYESSTQNRHNRRDIVLPNYAEFGYWRFLRSHYGADYVVVDAKNSGSHVKKADVLQLANYLSSHGAGLFGLIMCRKGVDTAAQWTIREQWTMHRKLIVSLNDEDVLQLLEAKRSDTEPEALIRQKIEDFRLGI